MTSRLEERVHLLEAELRRLRADLQRVVPNRPLQGRQPEFRLAITAEPGNDQTSTVAPYDFVPTFGVLAGEFSWDAPPPTTTKLLFHKTDGWPNDQTSLLLSLKSGDVITAAPGAYTFQVSGDPVDGGAHVEVPVTNAFGSGSTPTSLDFTFLQDGLGTYPGIPDKPNTYWIKFLDGEFTPADNFGCTELSQLNLQRAPRTTCHSLTPFFIPLGTVIPVFRQNAQWFTDYGLTTSLLKAKLLETLTRDSWAKARIHTPTPVHGPYGSTCGLQEGDELYVGYDWLGQEQISADKEVLIAYFPSQDTCRCTGDSPPTCCNGWYVVGAECEDDPSVQPPGGACPCLPDQGIPRLAISNIANGVSGCVSCTGWNIEWNFPYQLGPMFGSEACHFLLQQNPSLLMSPGNEQPRCNPQFAAFANFPCAGGDPAGLPCDNRMELWLCESNEVDISDSAVLDIIVGGCSFLKMKWFGLTFTSTPVAPNSILANGSCDGWKGLAVVDGLNEINPDTSGWDPRTGKIGVNPATVQDGFSPATLPPVGTWSACSGFVVNYITGPGVGWYNFNTGTFSETPLPGYQPVAQSQVAYYDTHMGGWLIMEPSEALNNFPPCSLITLIDPYGCDWLTAVQGLNFLLRFA